MARLMAEEPYDKQLWYFSQPNHSNFVSLYFSKIQRFKVKDCQWGQNVSIC